MTRRFSNGPAPCGTADLIRPTTATTAVRGPHRLTLALDALLVLPRGNMRAGVIFKISGFRIDHGKGSDACLCRSPFYCLGLNFSFPRGAHRRVTNRAFPVCHKVGRRPAIGAIGVVLRAALPSRIRSRRIAAALSPGSPRRGEACGAKPIGDIVPGRLSASVARLRKGLFSRLAGLGSVGVTHQPRVACNAAVGLGVEQRLAMHFAGRRVLGRPRGAVRQEGRYLGVEQSLQARKACAGFRIV